jgi:cysteinyl-tRNA synthetase
MNATTTITLYDSLSRSKKSLIPIDPDKVRVYVCGITVYDYCHLGHARMMIVFDVLARHLRDLYGRDHVCYVRNITDVDDKIIRRAKEQGVSLEALTAEYIHAMDEDETMLGNDAPDIQPRATTHIRQMIEMIETLVEKDFAYLGKNGDVYFRVRRFDGYGALSGRSLDDLKIGARVEADESKDDPLDFVLWKAAKAGEPSWASPWGQGRPGWHIECSAMAVEHLGNRLDIHGGGMDLMFPHHENEIAQSEACSGEMFSSIWVHNGFVQLDNDKMSKSLGNFFTIRDVLASGSNRERTGAAIRYMVLASHYRSPLNYSDKSLAEADAALERMYLALASYADALPPGEHVEGTPISRYIDAFTASMNDDLNTPSALAVLHDVVSELNRAIGAASDAAGNIHNLAVTLRALGDRLGIFRVAVGHFLGRDNLDASAKALMSEREQARAARDWARADELRDRLNELGYLIEDGPQGPQLRKRD